MHIEIFTDGGSRSNPGKAAVGVVVKHKSTTVFLSSKFLGIATNNEAEYEGFLFSLEWLKTQTKLEVSHVTWKLDSMLVVEQLNKRWKIKEVRLQVLAQKAWTELSTLALPFSIQHIPRSENKDADLLVNKELDSQE